MSTRLRPKFLTTTVKCKAKVAKNRLNQLGFPISLGLWLAALSAAEAAIPLTTARIGVGPTRVQTTGHELTSWGSFGTFRFANYQERLRLLAGFDLTAYRIQDAPKVGWPHDIDGNDVLVFLGYSNGLWNLWGGFGAGQMRIYDRPQPDSARPHRSISQVIEAGASYDLYRSQYGKIDASLSWKRLTPEKGWRSAYALSMIDCLQIQIGLKLLGW